MALVSGNGSRSRLRPWRLMLVLAALLWQGAALRVARDEVEPLEGCNYTLKIYYALIGNSGESTKMFARHCDRCNPGYVEVLDTVSPSVQFVSRVLPEMSKEALADHIKVNLTFSRQSCQAAPCGVDCTDCVTETKTRFKIFSKNKVIKHHTCRTCRTDSPLEALLADPRWMYRQSGPRAVSGPLAERSSQQVVHQKCFRRLDVMTHPGINHLQRMLHVLADHLTITLPNRGLQQLPNNVLEVVQLLSSIGLFVDEAFKQKLQEDGKNATEVWGDMVEKGVDYQAELLRNALGSLGEVGRLKEMASVLTSSPVLAQVQGALQLCMDISMGQREVARWPDPSKSVYEWDVATPLESCMQEAKWRMIGATCTRVQATFSQIRSLLVSLIGEPEDGETADVPDYSYRVSNVKPSKEERDLVIEVDAPQKTVVDVLTMVDFFGHPRSVVPATVLQSSCPDAAH